MKTKKLARVISILTVIVMLLATMTSCSVFTEGAQDGKGGVDGKSAYELAVENGYQGTLEQWLASLVGEAGAPGKDGANGSNGEDGKDGADGKNGKSAYELAVANGYKGTETQ